MSVTGKWTVTLKSPMGAMEGTLDLKENGGVVTGTQSGQGQTNEISNGKVDGDKLTWSSQITKPMPIKLDFSATVTGDAMTGQAKAGAFGTFPFSGKRA
jgi:hypothetical protein